jgi:hypothetical protein
MLSHPIKACDAIGWFERCAMVEAPEKSVDCLGRAHLRGQRINYDYGKLEAFCLMDSHYLHVALREGLVGILIFVDPALVEEPQEGVEELSPQPVTVGMCDDRETVVGLERVQQLGQNRETARAVLVAYRGVKWLFSHQLIKEVSDATVEGSPFLQAFNLSPDCLHSICKRGADRLACEIDNRLVDVVPEVFKGPPVKFPSFLAVPTQDQCEAPNHQPDLLVVKEPASSRAEGWNPASAQGL